MLPILPNCAQEAIAAQYLHKCCEYGFGCLGRRMDDFWCSQGVELDASAWHSRCLSTASSPASPTKETVERLSLFCQSILAKTNKTPMFPIKTEAQGIFCFIQGCVVYLQVFLSVFVDLVANRTAVSKYLNLFTQLRLMS